MGRTSYFRFLALAGAAILAAGVYPAHAQDADDLKRGVARISLINGEVTVRRGDSGEWVAAVINAPLLTDDRIATGPNSRAEVQFDASNVLRIGGNAEVRLAQLEYGRYQMELAHGTVTYRVLRPSDVNVELDTPSVSVRPSKQGTYRISVNEAGESEITARVGDVEVFTPRGSQWVRSGQTLMARGTAADPEFQVVAALGYDDWDRWSDSRDRVLTQSVSSRYVPQGVYGAEDLDTYGSWTNVPSYGNVWRPTVGADWAPYSSGRWVWEDWYGWTWVSYDPWGWAPYHYGRWFRDPGFGWCWYPGAFYGRHYWSPALVGFFGFGHGGGFGFGFGNIGWVPLAPFETFHPWWGRGFGGNRTFINNSVNVTNVNITNIYRNARVNNGINGMSVNDFQSGRFHNVQRVSGNQLGQAGVFRGQVPIQPNSAHLNFSDRAVTNVPRTNENARFFQHQQPNAVQRTPFNQQGSGTPGMAARQPNGFAGNRQAVSPGGIRSNQIDGAGANAGGNNGWRRFGAPAGQSLTPTEGIRNAAPSQPSQVMRNDRPAQSSSGNQAPIQRDNRGGWQRFGDPGTTNNAPRQPNNAPPMRQDYRGNQGYGGVPQYSQPSGGYSRQDSIRIAPPVVRDRSNYNYNNAPSYSAPRQYSAPPSYNAPRQYSAPSYSAPRQSAPSYSAPRGYSGGGGGHPSGGGGGGNRGHR